MQTIKITIPYHKRRLHAEIKHRGGINDTTAKTWNLPDTCGDRIVIENEPIKD